MLDSSVEKTLLFPANDQFLPDNVSYKFTMFSMLIKSLEKFPFLVKSSFIIFQKLLFDIMLFFVAFLIQLLILFLLHAFS